MAYLFDAIAQSGMQLVIRRKRGGALLIQRTRNGERLLIQADNLNANESAAISAAQRALDRDPGPDGFRLALQILAPYTHGIFMLSTPNPLRL